jgi:glutaredoxin
MDGTKHDTITTKQSQTDAGPVRLVMYGRRFGCYDQTRAQHWLSINQIDYDFVDIGADPEAAKRLQSWVGHLSVPTLIVAQPGAVEPQAPPAALQPGQRTRGTDRGTMITEPSDEQLARWLVKHGLFSF